MNTIVVFALLCLPALILAEDGWFDAESRLAEYADNFPATEGDFHHDCMVLKTNETEVGPLGATAIPNRLWPGRTLSYEIMDGYFTEGQKYKIRMAANQLSRVTRCVRVVENKNARDRVFIRKCGNACNSQVGKIGGRQQMCMADWCVNERGSMMHEFIHALGFQHEHQRPDRDSYLYVNYQNIQKRWYSAFSKFSSREVRLLTRYDYGSIMHYGAYSSFAINQRQPVMIPRESGAKIGNRISLTTLDIAKIQILYGCRSVLDSTYFKDLAGVQ